MFFPICLLIAFSIVGYTYFKYERDNYEYLKQAISKKELIFILVPFYTLLFSISYFISIDATGPLFIVLAVFNLFFDKYKIQKKTE